MNRQDVIDYLQRQAVQPFAWGKTDCVQMAAGLIELARGVRPSMPAYKTETEAKRWLVENGGLEAAVSSVLGPAQRDLRLCGDGDIVLTSFHGQHALGIALPRLFYVRRQTDGSAFDPTIIPLDMQLAIRWWPCLSS